METKIARILSMVFHPTLMPTYGVLIYFYLQSAMGLDYPLKVKVFLLLFIFLTTFTLPLFLTFIMLRLKIINSLEMHTRSERIIPLFVTATLYYITFYSLKSTGFFLDLQLFMLGTTILILLTVFINYFIKISIHMIGIGGISGAIIALAFTYKINLIHLISITVIFSGLLGYARLKTGAHKEFQIYSGYLTGFTVMFLLFILFQ